MTQSSRNPDKVKYVSLVRGRWIYRPYIPKKDRHRFPDIDRNGFITPIKLGVEADPWHRIIKAHATVLEDHANLSERKEFTLRWIVEQYEASHEFNNLAQSTRTSSKGFRRILDHSLTLEGSKAALGDLYLEELSLPLVKQIRDTRLKTLQSKGKAGSSQCNREISFLSASVQWAMHQYDEFKVNPFRGLRALKESKRTRYVTDAEYATQYEKAKAMKGYEYLPVVFELAYLLACRGAEVCDLKISDTELTDDGRPIIKVARLKGSKTTHIDQSVRLAQAIAAAKALHPTGSDNPWLLPGSKGGRLNKATVNTAMQRLKRKMTSKKHMSIHTYEAGRDQTEKPLFWTLHDLKRKGISDADDARIGGHRSASMRERYDTKVEVFEAPR